MTWIWSNLDFIWDRTLDHLVLSVPPIILSFLIALPIGWLAHRFRLGRGFILISVGLLYAIPSLPLFVVLPAIVGTSGRDPLNLVIALTIYGVALMVRVVADGLASVDPDVRLSATAVGFSGWALFWQVQLPLAGPVLLAGLRVVAVSTVSLATVGAVIGVQSLGSLFTDGFQRGIEAEIVAGIVCTVLLALAFDGALVALGRLLMPWSRPARPTRSSAPLTPGPKALGAAVHGGEAAK
ncbi:ABC transporter permease [Cryobacterium sp. Sr8]|uniref:Osmoprotectant transport system permease protein n=1 Tax=Cryobacterium psychrotolerans TaxID=386301 RepID=A0A1G9G3T2_9MICO|nr:MULTISPECIES: ABC transporter permease [Cryobacterium]TFD44197.1 ABC transporter permease [Cryobacterium sp. TMT1-2-1]TFD77930.1 ABC transporter permease [Cryobacterium sp. Sr8]TFD89362.1 ABC transporter permease [Cryobacterium psychrotolerans]SDK95344.1 osmoprotectant transport system permease protein [Cryobacterium psychrotolerans]